MYKILCGYLFSILLGIHLGVETLSHMVTVFNRELSNCFAKWPHHFTVLPPPQQYVRAPISGGYILIVSHW